MRVEAGSCGTGVGCVTASEVESDTDEDSVLEGMPKSAVVVAESTLSGVAILRRTRRVGSEHVVMNIAV